MPGVDGGRTRRPRPRTGARRRLTGPGRGRRRPGLVRAHAIELRGPASTESTPSRLGGELLRQAAGATRGWLKVQDGCDRKCSFCATRLARGGIPLADAGAEGGRRSPAPRPERTRAGRHRHPHRPLRARSRPKARLCRRLCATLLDEVPDVRLPAGQHRGDRGRRRCSSTCWRLRGTPGAAPPHAAAERCGPGAARMRRWHTRGAVSTAGPRDRRASAVRSDWGRTYHHRLPGRDRGGPRGHHAALVDELPFTYLHVFPFSPFATGPWPRICRIPCPSGSRASGAESSGSSRSEKGRSVPRRRGSGTARPRSWSRASVAGPPSPATICASHVVPDVVAAARTGHRGIVGPRCPAR